MLRTGSRFGRQNGSPETKIPSLAKYIQTDYTMWKTTFAGWVLEVGFRWEGDLENESDTYTWNGVVVHIFL